MTPTLISLPIETLHTICGYLTKHDDIANVRLVCRLLSDIGIRHLAQLVSFVMLLESMTRLTEISRHPILRHNVLALSCYSDVLPWFDTLEEWKVFARRPGLQLDWPVLPGDVWALDSDRAAHARHQIPDAELKEGWAAYKATIAKQQQLISSLEHSQELKEAMKRLPKLSHIYIHHAKHEQQMPNVSHYKGLFDNCLVQPIPFPGYIAEISHFPGFPGAKPLTSLLNAIPKHNNLKTIAVQLLDVCFFNVPEAKFESLRESIREVCEIEINIFVHEILDDNSAWESARQTLSTSRLKHFLTSASNLETIDLGFTDPYEGSYIANTIYVFPTHHMWPHLKRVSLTFIGVHPPSFLEFIRAHEKCLDTLILNSCDLVATNPESDNQIVNQSSDLGRWSEIFIPIYSILHLSQLSLSGTFTVCRAAGRELPYSQMNDLVKDVGCTVAETLDMLICWNHFDEFLKNKVDLSEGPSIEEMKRTIIRDLVDDPPPRSEPPRAIEISTRYSNYLEMFRLSNEEWMPEE